jgi:hypothetical protein
LLVLGLPAVVGIVLTIGALTLLQTQGS